jgi:hypothetical protein
MVNITHGSVRLKVGAIVADSRQRASSHTVGKDAHREHRSFANLLRFTESRGPED